MSNEEVVAPPAAAKARTSSWDWLLPAVTAFVIFKLFGLIGGLVAVGLFYLLKPKLGIWGAIAVAGVGGVALAIGLGFLIRA